MSWDKRRDRVDESMLGYVVSFTEFALFVVVALIPPTSTLKVSGVWANRVSFSIISRLTGKILAAAEAFSVYTPS